jgi:hypothetical protein
MAYEVDKSGKVVAILELPIKTFSQEIPPPPGAPAAAPPARLGGPDKPDA